MYDCQSCSRSAEQGVSSLSSFAPENLVSRDGFGSSVPRQPAHLHTQTDSAYGISLSPFAPENLASRNGSAIPSRVSLLISILRLNLVLTYGIPLQFRGGAYRFILTAKHHRVTQLRTDGVHCRGSAGTGPVNLKVVPNGCCLGRFTMDQLVSASLSHTHYWYQVGMLEVPYT